MPRYEHDGYVIVSAEPMTEAEVRAQVAADRAADAEELLDEAGPDRRSPIQRRDAQLLAEKFAEPIGRH